MTIPPISHSRITKLLTCGKQYYHTSVVKDVKESQGEAAMWGEQVHLAIENRLRDGTPLPTGYEMYEGYCQSILDKGGKQLYEVQLTIDRQLQPCDWQDPNAFWRAIADVLILKGDTALVIDHKTGKYKPGSTQLQETALLVFHTFPEVQTVKTAYTWLSVGKRTVDSYQRADTAGMWQRLKPMVLEYMTAYKTDTWVARPSGLCKGWCPVTSCVHWRAKRK